MKLKSKYIKLNKNNRLYGLDIPVIALTGSIATGKSTAIKLLKEKNIPFLDADQLVKLVYQKEAAIKHIQDHYPEVFEAGQIQFRKLREIFFSNPKVKTKIENLIYTYLPRVFKEELSKLGNPSFVVYDIPLLFEKNLESKFDLNLLVYTTPDIQVERLMQRDQHTREEALNIIGHQLSIEEKKKRADFVIENTRDLSFLENQVHQLIHQLLE